MIPACKDSSQVRSGQVRSECLTCTFRASCCSARLSRAQVPTFAGSFVQDRKQKGGGSKGVPPALAGAREYEQPDRNRKEGHVLFNDALNTFYLRLYGIGHMVKYHSDSERKPAAATWLLVPINSKGSFICTIPQTG